MPLILHPDGGKLLRTATGLAGSTDCCCDLTGCDLFESCFGTPTGAEYPDWEGVIQISGVTGDFCEGECDAVNTTFDATTPLVCDMVGPEECAIGWGGLDVGSSPIVFCDIPADPMTATPSGSICIWYDGTDWNVYAEIGFLYTDHAGSQNGNCSLTLTGQDALDVVNELCNGGTVALIMDTEFWSSFELCDCIGATLTATLTAA